jgi:hypothetical protein
MLARLLPAAAAFCVFAQAAPARAQQLDPSFPVTDHDIFAAALAGHTLYIGGQFQEVGHATGPMVSVDPSTGEVVGSFPIVDGEVMAAAPDGQGGWYIGGWFQHVAGVPRASLAHIRQDGSLDGWNPGADHPVHALALRGQRVYVGGEFLNIGGQARAFLAEVDAVTGLATGWDPALTGTFPSVDLLALKGDTLVVCGSFDGLCGAARSTLAEVDVRTGLVTPWNPAPVGPVAHMCLAGPLLYVSGAFSSIGGQTRTGLAAIDLSTGLTTAWNPVMTTYSVLTIAATAGTVYIGGNFTQVEGHDIPGLAALDAGTALPKPWNPNTGITVDHLYTDGTTLYVSGTFRAIAGQTRLGLAAYDVATGSLTGWNPSPDASPDLIAPDGSALLLAGPFKMLGVLLRNGLAAIDVTTGQVTPWDPHPDLAPLALAAKGSTLYACGWFSSIGTQARPGVAAIDSTTALPLPWNPVPAGGITEAIDVGDSGVYLGGAFSSVSGVPRGHLAAVDASSGDILPWNPGTDGEVYFLKRDRGVVYATGAFDSVGGAAHMHAAAISANSGETSAWDPELGPGDWLNAVAGGAGVVYVGGQFTSIGGAARNGLAALDSVTATAVPWYPLPDNVGIGPLALRDSIVYVTWSTLDPVGATVTATNATTGAVSAWNAPIVNLDIGPPYLVYPWVHTIVADDSRVYVCGQFTTVCGQPRMHLAAVEAAAPDPWAVSVVYPGGGESLPIGAKSALRWTATAPHGVQSADLYISRTGPTGPWELIAAGVANTSEYGWSVSGPEANGTAYVRVDARDWLGTIVSAHSVAAFSIASHLVAVDGPSPGGPLALEAPAPNPSRGPMSIVFVTPARAHVRLSVYDVQGREVALLVDEMREAGRHVATLQAGAMRPGLYFVRMACAGRTLSSRGVVLR